MARTPTAPPDRVKPPERGFTLVELVTTLAILAITLALAAPALNDLRQRQQAIATGNLLVTHLNLARHHAVTRRVPTLACPSHDLQTCRPGSDWSGGWIVFSDRDGNRRPDRADDILWAERIPRQRDIRITTSANRSKVRYNTDGRSSGSNLTFTVCTRRGLLNQIIINNAGRVRLGRSASATACA